MSNDIPPTEPKIKNPDVGKPAVAGGAAVAAPPRRKPKTKLDGKQFVADLDKHRTAVSTLYWYWVGVTPSCPVEHLDFGGINFPKLNENILIGPNDQQQRIPVIGSLVKLTSEQIKRIRERVSRTVIRFTGNQEPREESDTGKGLKSLANERPPRGMPIKIPTPEEIEQKRKNNQPARLYVQDPRDVPAARYVFCKLCTNQETGERGDVYPETLETAGLEWPDDLD